MQLAILFWHSAANAIRIGAKIRKKSLSSWQKRSKSNSKPSQSTNQSSNTLSLCGLVDFHLSSATGWDTWGSLFLLISGWIGHLEKDKLKTFTADIEFEDRKKPRKFQTSLSGIRGTILTFFWLRFQINTQIFGKSFWICQMNKLCSFPCQIWNSAVFWQSVIDVWMTLCCFVNNQSIKRWFYFQSMAHKNEWCRKK